MNASGAFSRHAGSPTIRSRLKISLPSSTSRASVCVRLKERSFEKVQKAVKNRIAAIESQAALAAFPGA